MKITATVLIVIGIVGLLLSMAMFGDIGIAAAIGSLASLVSGIGFIQANKIIENQG